MSTRPRVALVTGATGAIGRAIAAGIARRPDYELVIVGRDAGRVQQLVAELCRKSERPRLRSEIVDLSSHASIAELAARFEGPLDVLINNAAVAPPRRQVTAQGIEQVFATNVLGYVWMMQELLSALSMGNHARIVNVASYWAGDLDSTDLEFKQRRYDNDAAYRQSKQANRMLTAAWAERLRDRDISVNSCHPGDVNSRLSNDLGFGGAESPETGAETPLWVATSDDVAGATGRYFERRRESNCRFSKDREAVLQLAELCDSYG